MIRKVQIVVKEPTSVNRTKITICVESTTRKVQIASKFCGIFTEYINFTKSTNHASGQLQSLWSRT